MNELHKESSPYLLQHASNPVHWKAWNPDTLQLAKDGNKLIIISIGYSACHWCHVMEHETFENEDAALVMNRGFVNIKVDREERPDVDAVYMKSVQIMTGRGGWPMNVVALPDGRPVWGGTYFRKEEWIDTLEQLEAMYKNNPEKILEYADKLHTAMVSISVPVPPQTIVDHTAPEEFSMETLLPLVDKWKKSFDTEYGGMARAPKFMMPSNYSFLMAYAKLTDDRELSEFVGLTLTRMAWGGLFDTLAGGFSRYSVDMRWHVPHFEKMLYDNGQLVSLYADAYKSTKDPLYKEVIEKTLDFIERELSNGEGGFYSALDADSLNHGGVLEEGAYYVWTTSELQHLLGDDFEDFSKVFNVNSFGHWEHGNHVLIQNETIETLSKQLQIDSETLRDKKRSWERLLLSERDSRPRPRLDDKCLTSWNALMLHGYVDAYKATGTSSYLETALANAEFIRTKLWSESGNLYHSYKEGKASINGYLEDYALVIKAYIALYQVTLNERFVTEARQLCDYCLDYFFDAGSGFFRFTSSLDEALVATHYETEDNVIPASNSVMAANLYKLATLYEHAHYDRIARNMLIQIVPGIDYPSAFSNWLECWIYYSNHGKQLAVTGPDAIANMNQFNSFYYPEVFAVGAEVQSSLPFLQNKHNTSDQYFLCINKACGLPVHRFEDLAF